jgi:hypothetical protein
VIGARPQKRRERLAGRAGHRHSRQPNPRSAMHETRCVLAGNESPLRTDRVDPGTKDLNVAWGDAYQLAERVGDQK